MTEAMDRYHERMKDCAYAIEHGMGYSELADLWLVSVPAAWMWCQKRLKPEDCVVIAQNGRLNQGAPRTEDRPERAACSYRDRLELVHLARSRGWADAKLARAMGLRPSALCEWIKRNAPDGIDDALSDFEEAA